MKAHRAKSSVCVAACVIPFVLNAAAYVYLFRALRWQFWSDIHCYQGEQPIKMCACRCYTPETTNLESTRARANNELSQIQNNVHAVSEILPLCQTRLLTFADSASAVP